MTAGAAMFASYADNYADWIARGKPASPSLPSKFAWKRSGGALIDLLSEAQGHACSLCGKSLSERDRTIEHVLPLSLGGGNHRNKLVAHGACNRRKGASPPTGCELILLDAVNTMVYLLDPRNDE